VWILATVLLACMTAEQQSFAVSDVRHAPSVMPTITLAVQLADIPYPQSTH